MYRSFCCRRSASLDRTTGTDTTDSRSSRCHSCPVWQSLPTIRQTHCAWPARLSRKFESFTPALWVIPSRCYWRHAEISEPIRRGSDLFYRFKAGQSSLAFPLALAMYEGLKHRASQFDCVVPIPLSPDKQEMGHINRTRILAQELAALLGIQFADALSLKGPISKRSFLSSGCSHALFESRYFQLLEVDATITNYARLLLLDDVCTHGSTLNSALRRIREAHPGSEITATTAGQMLLKNVVTHEQLILGPKYPTLFAH